jgi:MinD superfamily P-loop ATPase
MTSGCRLRCSACAVWVSRVAAFVSLAATAMSALSACDNVNNDTKLVCDAERRSGAVTKDPSGAEAEFKLMMEWAELKVGTPEGKELVTKLKRADMMSRAKLLREAQANVKLDQCGLADWVEASDLGRLHH